MALTHKARVGLPEWEILFGLSVLETTLYLTVTNYSKPSAQTTFKNEALEILINNITVGLAVRICGFRPQGPGSTPGLGNFVRIECFRNHVTFGRNKVLNTVCTNHNQTRGAGNDINNIPVGLANRICGSHPQGPGWTPGVGNFVRIERFRNHVTFGRNKVLNTVPSAQITVKHEALEILINNIPVGLAVRICGFRQQGPGSTPALGKLVRIERFRNRVTFGRNKLLKTVCTNHNQT